MAWQIHGRARLRGGRPRHRHARQDFEQGDGLWTEKPGRALGLLTADCFPVVLARRNGTPRPRRPPRRLAGAPGRHPRERGGLGRGPGGSRHRPGNRALLLRGGEGGRRAVPRALRRRRHAGAEPRPRRGDRARPLGGRGRDRRAHRPLHELRARALLLASPRPAAARGGKASLPISADEVRANYARIQDEVGGRHRRRGHEVRLLEEMEALAEAGVPVVGENRAPGSRGRSTRASARASAGTSSGTCSPGRRRTSPRSASSSTPWTRFRRPSA